MSNVVGVRFAVKDTVNGMIRFNGNGTGWKEFSSARGYARTLGPKYVVVVIKEIVDVEIVV